MAKKRTSNNTTNDLANLATLLAVKEDKEAENKEIAPVQDVSVTENKEEKAPKAASVDEKTPAPMSVAKKADDKKNNKDLSDKLHPLWKEKLNSSVEISYFSVEREMFIRNGKSSKNSAARYALRFVRNNKENLEQLDLIDLSAIIDDLARGYLHDKRKEQESTIKDLCALALKKIENSFSLQDATAYEKDAVIDIFKHYRKYVARRIPDAAFALEKQLKPKAETLPKQGPIVTISQVSLPKEFEHLNIDEINALAAPLFEKAKEYARDSDEAKKHRRDGNRAITSACLNYINLYLRTDENWDQLSIRELVYLHKNIRFDRKQNNLAKTLAEKCDKRLRAFEAKITAEENVAAEDIVALKDFCHYRARDLEKQTDEESIAQVATYKSARFKLDRAEKKQKGGTDITKPQKEKEHPEQTPALAQAFEKACEKENVRYDKNEQEVLEYNLFSPNAPAEAEPSGKLSIASETDVTLQSDEFKHFLALAQAIKDSGGTQIDIGTLSPDPQEAKKFISLMVLAGYKAKIRVNFPDTYSMKDLAKVNPEIEKMQKIKRFKAEMNKLQKQGDKQEFRKKQVEYFNYLLEHGDVYDTRSKEERQEYFAERINKVLGKNQVQEQPAPKQDNSAQNPAVAAAVLKERATTR